MENNRPTHRLINIFYGLGAFFILIALLTYGRWEWLSKRYGIELERVAVIQFEAAGIAAITKADDIAEIKVFACGSEKAELFLEDVQGNKWLLRMRRAADGSTWTAHYDGEWQIGLIHAANGGKPQHSWYWY